MLPNDLILFFFKLLDSYVSPQVQSTAGFHSDVPAVPFQEPINYSTSNSSSSSPPQSGWIAADNCLQEVTQSNFNYSDGFQPDQQPQQQDSSYYWNNWEYSPPFHSSGVARQTFYSNTDPSSHYSSCYYSPETTNQFYYQSYV